MSEKRERRLRRSAREEAARPAGPGERYCLPIRYTLGVGPRPVCWSDLFGMDPDFTGDLTTDEYLDAGRGEA